MTKSFNLEISCPKCRHRFAAENGFCAWMRKERSLDSGEGIIRSDFDNVILRVHECMGEIRYGIMILEVKTYDATPSKAQADLNFVIHQIIQQSSRRLNINGAVTVPTFPDTRSPYNDRDVIVRYYGYHLLRFARTNPEDSPDGIFWDGVPITTETLIGFLKLDLDPLQPRNPRSLRELMRDRHRQERKQMLLKL